MFKLIGSLLVLPVLYTWEELYKSEYEAKYKLLNLELFKQLVYNLIALLNILVKMQKESFFMYQDEEDTTIYKLFINITKANIRSSQTNVQTLLIGEMLEKWPQASMSGVYQGGLD